MLLLCALSWSCTGSEAHPRASGVLGDRCASDDDCRDGYCLDVEGARICTEPCRRDRDCPAARNWWCAAPSEIDTPLCLCHAAPRNACGADLDRDCDGELDPCTGSAEGDPGQAEDPGSGPRAADAAQVGVEDSASGPLSPRPTLDAGGGDAGRIDAGSMDAASPEAGAHDAGIDAALKPDAARAEDSASAADATSDAGGSDASVSDAGGYVPPEASTWFPRLDEAVSVAMYGPYQTASYSGPISSRYGAATIYHPTNHASEPKRPLALVALMSEFVVPHTRMQWWGPVLASHGFATVVVGAHGEADLPDQRADALEAGLAALKAEHSRVGSPLRDGLDLSRVGLLGHGMGGGAVALLLDDGASLAQCAVLWEPWRGESPFSVTPTAIFAIEQDLVAAPEMAWSAYAQIPSTTPKLYVEWRGDNHMAPTDQGTESERAAHVAWTVAFLKLHLESDTRYDPLLSNDAGLVRYDRKP
jgi:hypothetical protein